MNAQSDLKYSINMTECQLKNMSCLMNIVYFIENRLRDFDKTLPKVSEDDISTIELLADDLKTFNELYSEQTDEIYKCIDMIKSKHGTLFEKSRYS